MGLEVAVERRGEWRCQDWLLGDSSSPMRVAVRVQPLGRLDSLCHPSTHILLLNTNGYVTVVGVAGLEDAPKVAPARVRQNEVDVAPAEEAGVQRREGWRPERGRAEAENLKLNVEGLLLRGGRWRNGAAVS